MKKKTYKQLEEELIDLKIKEHKDNYIHIPKLSLLALLGTLFFGFLSYMNLKLIDWEVIGYIFNCTDGCNELITKDLINIYPITGEFILISLTIISLVALFKGGYDELKDYGEGLIAGLIFGLIIGLIIGLISEFD